MFSFKEHTRADIKECEHPLRRVLWACERIQEIQAMRGYTPIPDSSINANLKLFADDVRFWVGLAREAGNIEVC